MKKLILTGILLFSAVFNIYSQGTAGEKAKFEYRYLIDMPTGGILEKGAVGLTTDILPDGVLVTTLEAGVFENVSFGISYGGSNLIGSGKVEWYKLPGVNFRVRILNETILLPALTLGFDSQGKGVYNNDVKRYAIKSPGFFAAVSKNFDFLGYLSLHGSINYSLEGKDGDNFVNIRAGAEKTLGSSFSLLIEYDFALNDNKSASFGDGKGYLNTGIRWSVGSGLTIGFDLRDLLSNKSETKNAADRALRIEFIKTIF
ncbi:MAG: YjbH domain-containing protein [Ignavibacteria bacterium]|nr:YjbH domain-containing protein [Ignavibacteria bacterium]MBT8381565.1 YjbH domain-containing protein [Ignavibacteria bacterium]MBT8391893.1 YjbH domain-containing protein [Ignavibacteria bacterium]NNJ53301.1 hypothetical protein [Ignavibacteriaceae bacterium]NNL22239.1 hypothetical protein [Ignavibacteriaceae bacterium]